MSDLHTNNTLIQTPPDFHLHLKGVPFHLHKEILAKKSAKVRLLLNQNKLDHELQWILTELDINPKTFEIIARFCYGYKVKFSSENIIWILCIAYYLQMNEEQSSNNLLTKSSEFLEQQVLTNWNETLKALKSGHKILEKVDDVGLVDVFFDSIIEMASIDPKLIKNNESLESRDDFDEYRPNPRRQLFVIEPKSEDLITLPLRLYENLMIRALKSNSIPVEYLVWSICNFVKKWVFEDEESVSRRKRDVIEAMERLLPDQIGLVSCEFLFESLKHSIWLDSSLDCRNGFEIRISKQLDIARSSDFKILSRKYSNQESNNYEDVELVKNILKKFYSYYINESDVSRFVKVAKLIEEFLFEAANDSCLSLENFVSLADTSIAISQGILRFSDGIYRAIAAFLDSHLYLTESEKMEVCKVLECRKLSPEVCDLAAKNERLPLRIVVQILFIAQLQIRDLMSKEIDKTEEIKEEEIEVSSEEDDDELKLMNTSC